MAESNLLVLDIERHNAWHKIFKNMSFLEVIYLLIRTLKAKKHQDADEAQSLLPLLKELDNGKDSGIT